VQFFADRLVEQRRANGLVDDRAAERRDDLHETPTEVRPTQDNHMLLYLARQMCEVKCEMLQAKHNDEVLPRREQAKAAMLKAQQDWKAARGLSPQAWASPYTRRRRMPAVTFDPKDGPTRLGVAPRSA